MSKYTTQLRWIVEQEQGNIPYSRKIRYTEDTYRKLGLDEYPIFEPTYRKVLNDKIIDHFFFREIGFETCAQFSWYMRRVMQEIMPFYNEMYKAQMKIDDPLSNLARSWREEWDTHSEDTGTVESSSATSNDNSSVYSDTPMSMLGNSGAPKVEDMDYATNVTFDKGKSDGESTRTTDMDKHDNGWRTHTESGRTKSQAELMKEYLEMFVNIDVKIIRELEDLFMALW